VTNPGVRVLSQIYCECRYFWRAVDHEGEVTERLVTKVRRRKVCAEILEEIPVPHRMSAL
jgi:transposase-like protein